MFVKGRMHNDAQHDTQSGKNIISEKKSNSVSCFVCGRNGHLKAQCPDYKRKVDDLMQQKKFHNNGVNRNQVWMKKGHLYEASSSGSGQIQRNSGSASRRTVRRRSQRAAARQRRQNQIQEPCRCHNSYCRVRYPELRYGAPGHWVRGYESPRHNSPRFWDEEYYTRPSRGYQPRRYDEWCNMALQLEGAEEEAWYFDSGCSRHMTGKLEQLQEVKAVKGGKVTFGDGGIGKIKGRGKTTASEQPGLMNVYFVEGLKANLISVSQLCDQGLKVTFTKKDCEAVDNQGMVKMRGVRSENNCYMWKNQNAKKCLSAKSDLNLWHQKLGHMNTRMLTTLVNQGCVRGVPELKCQDIVCGPCKKGKQIKVQHKKVQDVQTKGILELIHMDLMGPMQVESIGGKRYVFVLVDDFSRFTWVRFLREKSETLESFKIWALQHINQKGGIKHIRSDHGREFQNHLMDEFCAEHGIEHQYSAPRTPQQNGVVERKNRTLQEMARAMIHGNQISQRFWAEAISTACYIINRVYIRKGTTKTPYELWKGKIPNLSYFHVFDCRVYILNDKDHLGKFDSRSDESILLGYSGLSLAFRVYNQRTKMIEESVNVVFDDVSALRWESPASDSDSDEDTPSNKGVKRSERRGTVEAKKDAGKEVDFTEKVDPTEEEADRDTESKSQEDTSEDDSEGTSPNRSGAQVHRNHSSSDVIGKVSRERRTRRVVRDYKQMVKFASTDFQEMVMFGCFVSKMELENENWILAMEEELEQFARNEVWKPVPRPQDGNVVGTKWIFKNKCDADCVVVRNKAKRVAQGYSQVEGVDFDETFAPVARLESIRFLLGMAYILNFKLFQMDVKSAFLNGFLQEEVYVEQPKGFEDAHHPEYVYKLDKALYGLKQAPQAWYERLTSFLLECGYSRGSVDKTLFILSRGSDLMIVQIYVDDIIFGVTSKKLVDHFVDRMTKEVEMCMCGELMYFLRLLITQDDNGIFICQSTYAQNLVDMFGVEGGETSESPMSTATRLSEDEGGLRVNAKLYQDMIGSLVHLTASRPDLCYSVRICAQFYADPRVSHLQAVKRIVKYVKGTLGFGIYYTKSDNSNLVGYCGADWGGNLLDRRSISGGWFFLGENLVSWYSKKQKTTSLSTTEAKYIAMGSCCTHLLTMKQMASDYGLDSGPLLVYCDNTSTVDIPRDLVHHSRTEHIDVSHHFIRELVEDNEVMIEHVVTELQLADLFTKTLNPNRFVSLRKVIGVCEH